VTTPTLSYRMRVDVKINSLGLVMRVRGPLRLEVSGDEIRVFHLYSLSRRLFGQDYRFRAEELTISAEKSILRQWIVLSGPQHQILIARRGKNAEVWDALVMAGARPMSPPPLGHQ
jgi:hypothetical protein